MVGLVRPHGFLSQSTQKWMLWTDLKELVVQIAQRHAAWLLSWQMPFQKPWRLSIALVLQWDVPLVGQHMNL